MNRKRPFILIARKHLLGYTDSKDATHYLLCGGKGRTFLSEESVETVFSLYKENGNRREALRMAESILKWDTHVQGSIAIKAKREAENYMIEHRY